MFSALFTRWARSPSFTPSELQVIEALLLQRSSDASKLFQQAAQTPFVSRRAVGKSGYEATIPYIDDDSLLIETDQDVESPMVETIDSQSGRRLRFSTKVLRGGFLLGLRGVALDGLAWPRSWCVGSEIVQIQEASRSWRVIATRTDEPFQTLVLQKLTNWSGADINRISDYQKRCLRFAQPATDADIAQAESRLDATLVDQYKQFVKITNGFGIKRGRPYEILGTQDIDYLDDTKQWIGITPLYEVGYVALHHGDSATCYLLAPDGTANKIGDIRQHVQESLEWKECSESNA